MLGVVITLLFALGAVGLGEFAIGRWTAEDDGAARFGAHGLAGLGMIGLLTLFLGLLPGGLHWGVFVVGALALVGLGRLATNRPSVKLPNRYSKGLLGGIALALLLGLVGVVAPSDVLDWDTLAYHLAVPKMWLAAGQIVPVSFIHHSNFPFTVDNLYIWGLTWGGEPGAKSFSLTFAALGSISVFGLTRRRFGDLAGWWAAFAFATIPLVIWESGTGYVDVANGLFAGLGIWYAARYVTERVGPDALLAGIFLGLAAGSKYTGLQTIFVVGAVMLVIALRRREVPVVKPFLVGAIALMVCGPWYVKNVVTTGNPVYPFFYSVFHGKNWDAFGDRIYKEQQQTFGAGRAMAPNYTEQPLDPTRLGASVLGLAYQPGRYVDPAPTQGLGFPFASLGVVPLIGMFAWMISGRITRFEGFVVVSVLLSLLAWFVLSQQARYILGLMVPLCGLAGGGVANLRSRIYISGAILIQALASLVITTQFGQGAEPLFVQKLRVVLGTTSAEEYRAGHIGFFGPAQTINQLAKGSRVALFDEVFGYLLEVPYFWANPGHSTEIGYDRLANAEEFVASLHRLGITHAYINLGQTFQGAPEELAKWRAAAGLDGPAIAYPERETRMDDPRNKYKVLLAEAIAAGRLRPLADFGPRRILFEVP